MQTIILTDTGTIETGLMLTPQDNANFKSLVALVRAGTYMREEVARQIAANIFAAYSIESREPVAPVASLQEVDAAPIDEYLGGFSG